MNAPKKAREFGRSAASIAAVLDFDPDLAGRRIDYMRGVLSA
jgi:hypothetical protein